MKGVSICCEDIKKTKDALNEIAVDVESLEILMNYTSVWCEKADTCSDAELYNWAVYYMRQHAEQIYKNAEILLSFASQGLLGKPQESN